MASKNAKAIKKLSTEERVIDLLERLGATFLYLSTNLDKHGVARAIKVDNNRAAEILKGIEKQK